MSLVVGLPITFIPHLSHKVFPRNLQRMQQRKFQEMIGLSYLSLRDLDLATVTTVDHQPIGPLLQKLLRRPVVRTLLTQTQKMPRRDTRELRLRNGAHTFVVL
tara:strand:- start:240 stop:548 length:309 start_codon:yes stop_codon:yes gene_type:complete